MKKLLVFILFYFSYTMTAQEDIPIEISGSDFVVVPFSNISKIRSVESGIRFINTATGQIKTEMFSENSSLQLLKHVRIDPLNINCVVVLIQERMEKGTSTPKSMLIVYSKDGNVIKQTPIENAISENCIVKHETGKILLVSYTLNKKDYPNQFQEELLYDLKNNSLVKLK